MSQTVNYQEILELLLTSEIRFTQSEFIDGKGKKIFDRVSSKVTLVSDAAYVTGAKKNVNLKYHRGDVWFDNSPSNGNSPFLCTESCISGKPYRGNPNERTKGFIPSFPYSLISDIVQNQKDSSILCIDELGSICERPKQQELDRLLQSKQLTKIDEYPLDSIKPRLGKGYEIPFKLRNCPIYMDSNGNKYIRLKAYSYAGTKIQNHTVTGTEYYEEGKPLWLTITNPKIYYDPDNNYAIYACPYFSGIRQCDYRYYMENYWLPRFALQIAIAKVRKIMSDDTTPSTKEETEMPDETYLTLLLNTCNEDVQLTESYIKQTFSPKIAKLLLAKLKVLVTPKTQSSAKKKVLT